MAERTRDLYAVLGVPRDVDEEGLRKAYRKLAREHHPDLNPGDRAAEDRFKRISDAYAVLSDPEKRRDYDEFGDVSLQAGFDREAARQAREAFGARFGGARGARASAAAGEFSFGDIDDLMASFFGGVRGRGPGGGFAMPGSDVESELELDFVEAALGTEKRLVLPRPGAAGGVRHETVTVRIPPGVDDGGRIRIPGKGGEGVGGAPPGDLYVRIRVRPHPFFRREGRDVFVEVPVTLGEAALGARIEVPTLEGRATLTIPPGTDGGSRLRLRGKGVPAARGGERGDLYVIVQVRVPRDLDDEGRAAVERLARFGPADPRKGLGS
jgi:curved DNA-binding protein